MFGSTTAPTTSGFSFGATQPAAAAPSFGGFGSTAGQQQPTAAPAFGGFGSTPTANAPGAGGFGTSTTATTPTAGGFGGFGTTMAPAATAVPAAGGGGGFGTTPAAAAINTPSGGGFGGFGGTQTPGTTTPSASGLTGFGGAPNAIPGAGSFGAFGAPATAPATGAAAPTTGGFGSLPSFGGLPARSGGKIAKCFEKLQQSYAPFQDAFGRPATSAVNAVLYDNCRSAPSVANAVLNDDCCFKAVMYDRRSGPMQVPDSSLTGALLEQAEANNPDPDRYYPVRIVGIDALKARYDQQQQEAQKLREQSKELKSVVDAVVLSNTKISTRFSSLQMKQVHLYHRLLTTLRKIEVLRCRGVPQEDNEIRYRQRLEQLAESMKGPFMRIQELVSSAAQQHQQSIDVNGLTGGDGDMYVDVSPDDEDLVKLYDALTRQREGLEYITEILTKDIRDISLVKNAIK